MKNIILFLTILSISQSFSQSRQIDREREFIDRIERRQQAVQQEQQNLDLIQSLYDAVNNLQAVRKYHYEKRYDKQYLKRYKKRLLYGLYPETSWDKDRVILDEQLRQNMLLYNEQYQRCILYYSWSKHFPRDIMKFLQVNDLLNKY